MRVKSAEKLKYGLATNNIHVSQVPIPPDMLVDAGVADTFAQYEGQSATTPRLS